MICPKCHNTATHDMTFNSISYYICEHCGHSFGYVDRGEASEKEMDSLRRRVQERFESKDRMGKPVRETLIAAGVKFPEATPEMHPPEARGLTGDLKARG